MAVVRLRRGAVVRLLAAAIIAAGSLGAAPASGGALVGETCPASAPSPCGAGMRCATCSPLPSAAPAVCTRTAPVDPKTHGTGLAFNRYSWLTTHNSFAMAAHTGVIAPPNQEDTVTAQLKNGVRGLMLDTYDFENDVWLCHSFGGKCYNFTAYQPAVKVLKEVEAFLGSNPSEVITIFVEDYTGAGALGRVVAASGLTRFLFPPAKMPNNGGDWPLLSDMIAQNHRLLLFTSKQGKDQGLAYQWNYVLETKYGSEGLVVGSCGSRAESLAMDSGERSLLLLNFFTTNPRHAWACANNSAPLVAKLTYCHHAWARRWPNFIAVDFYMRSDGGGAPLATDVANGLLQCGCGTIAYCKANATFGACAVPPPSPAEAGAGGKQEEAQAASLTAGAATHHLPASFFYLFAHLSSLLFIPLSSLF